MFRCLHVFSLTLRPLKESVQNITITHKNAKNKYLISNIYLIPKEREHQKAQFVQCRNWEWPSHSTKGSNVLLGQNWSSQHFWVSISGPFQVPVVSREALKTAWNLLHMGVCREDWRSWRITSGNSCCRGRETNVGKRSRNMLSPL